MRTLGPATVLALTLAAAAAPAGAAVRFHDPLVVHHTAPAPDTATLEQCVSSPEQEERAATFSGEMIAIPGSTRMEMRIDVLEKAPEEESYRRVSAPGLGVWRSPAAGVKSFRYLKQVTNLAAPASYRGALRFRWFNAHGRQIGFAELRTRPCEETVVSPPSQTGVSPSSPPSGATLN